MLSFGIRVLIFSALVLAGLAWGWEFMVAGLIFAANVIGVKLEYLFLGLSYDLILSFPLGFFTLVTLVILLVALFSRRFFKETNFSSLAVKLFLVSLSAAFIIFFYFLKSFWPEPLPALRFASLSFLRILLTLAGLVILFKIMKSFHVRKIFSK